MAVSRVVKFVVSAWKLKIEIQGRKDSFRIKGPAVDEFESYVTEVQSEVKCKVAQSFIAKFRDSS